MYRRLAGLILLLGCSQIAAAQRRSATATLTVTVTVASSTMWVEQPDGSLRLVVANAYGGEQDMTNLLKAAHRQPDAQAAAPEVVEVSLVPPRKSPHKHAHRR